MLRGKTKIKQSKYKFYSIRSSTFRLANDESQTKQSNKYRNTLEKKETEGKRKRGHRLTHTHTPMRAILVVQKHIMEELSEHTGGNSDIRFSFLNGNSLVGLVFLRARPKKKMFGRASFFNRYQLYDTITSLGFMIYVY